MGVHCIQRTGVFPEEPPTMSWRAMSQLHTWPKIWVSHPRVLWEMRVQGGYPYLPYMAFPYRRVICGD